MMLSLFLLADCAGSALSLLVLMALSLATILEKAVCFATILAIQNDRRHILRVCGYYVHFSHCALHLLL
jgi:hypothetical protein